MLQPVSVRALKLPEVCAALVSECRVCLRRLLYEVVLCHGPQLYPLCGCHVAPKADTAKRTTDEEVSTMAVINAMAGLVTIRPK